MSSNYLQEDEIVNQYEEEEYYFDAHESEDPELATQEPDSHEFYLDASPYPAEDEFNAIEDTGYTFDEHIPGDDTQYFRRPQFEEHNNYDCNDSHDGIEDEEYNYARYYNDADY